MAIRLSNRDAVNICLCEILILLDDSDSNSVSVEDILSASRVSLSPARVRLALQELIESEHVRYTSAINKNLFEITPNGARRTESILSEDPVINKIYSDAGMVRGKINEIKAEENKPQIINILNECIVTIENNPIPSNQGNAQALSELRAAQALVEAPSPPWASILALLGPLAVISSIAGGIKLIIDLMTGG